MSILHAIILGIIEGIAEFLPISSSGHLLLASRILGLSTAQAGLFSVVVQMGAVLAIILYFHKELLGLLSFSSRPVGFKGYRGIGLLFVGTLPAVIVGFIIKQYFGVLFTEASVAFFLALGGVYIYSVEHVIKKRTVQYQTLDTLDYKIALYIGLFQCLALFPGFSRSTATIMGGLLLGLSRIASVRFSFLLSIPIILGASVLEIFSNHVLMLENITMLAIAGFVAFIVSMASISFLLGLLERITYIPFAIYRIVISIILFLVLTF